MPPLVLYKIPFIGHTFSYLFDCKEFLKQCRKEYGDIFSLYIWGQVKTFVGKEHAHEVLARDDAFDFGIVAVRKLPIDAMFVNGFGDSRYNIMAVKEYISKKLELYTERMQESLHLSIQRYIGKCEEPKVHDHLYKFLSKVIAAPIANIFIGESEEIITTFAEFTSSLFIFYAIPPVLDFVYPGLQDYVNRIPVRLGLYDPSARQRSMLIKHIKNQVDKRLREKQEYQDSWKRPNDLLQDFIEEKLFDPNKPNYNAIADKMAFFIFASIHTTSRASTYVLIDLASRPEYIQELYEEQLEIHKETDKNGILPIEAFNKMNKLDSFVKESLRLNENIAGLSHLTLKDYTFSNGLQIPKDHIF
ncbi:18230_t:CDS:2 [Funneliformis geosporum]|uniref:18230_t:CDS:1 n=1 Tax=Funneliformis geosporum TaxID=1117311 RepID=A0A9W4SWR8_9GLOM|nr:18230_t:CDS:2 [Funneliformis geosporum]